MIVDEIHHCSALDLLRTLPSNSIPLAIQDPPYGIGYSSSYQVANDNKSPRASRADFGDDEADLTWIPEMYRVQQAGGALYLFTRWDVLHIWKQALEMAGYNVAQCLIWDKKHWGGGDLRYYGPQAEHVLFAVKGVHNLRWHKREGNVWTLTKMDAINNEGNHDNPAQKPERLLQRAILRSSDPGDVVLDTFCGTGSTAAAARSLGRHYIICDKDQYQIDITCRRLEKPFDVVIPLFEVAT